MSPWGRQLARALTPSSDLDEIKRRQRLTAEAMALRRLKPDFGLGAITDLSALGEAAAQGAQLAPADLLTVAGFLQAARRTRAQLVPLGRELPQLSQIARHIGEFAPLITAIEGAIDARGEVLDGASPELSALRAASRVAHDRLLERVQRILDRAVAQGIAQEAIVTERDGRYVIPIKAESRGHLPSVVHDVSSSGATVFVEPLAAVELGNGWREARLAEQREVERILRRLSALVGAEAGAIKSALGAVGEIDFAMAKAELGVELQAGLPSANDALAWVVEAPGELRLQSARHPLLRGDVVPISVVAGGPQHGVLITGPNTGGKTVALKTVGLLALMAQAGLPLPAEPGTQVPAYQGVYADIGDEQSIEQSLSTFSSHMTNIIRILRIAGPQSLVLLDELGAGTDPTEGAALGRAILTHLLELDATVVATTHHGELKLFAHATEGVVNASVEFDAETIAPTYRLAMGLPGRSNAIAIARRLGMPESVLDEALARYSPQETDMESLLASLQREQAAASEARRAEEFARGEAEEIRAGLRRRREEVEGEREALLARTELEMEQHLAAVRQALRAAEKRIAKGDKEGAVSARTEMQAAERRLAEVRRARAGIQQRGSAQRRGLDHRRGRPAAPQAIEAGDVLYLEGVEQPGQALSAVDEDGYLDVQLGALRTRVHSAQVEGVGRGDGERPEQSRGWVRYDVEPAEATSRIELRGQTVEEALPAVEQFLDQAYRAGLQWLEVVHGKGTGTLRQVVRERLRRHPLVTKYEEAAPREGGAGVTIVHMAV